MPIKVNNEHSPWRRRDFLATALAALAGTSFLSARAEGMTSGAGMGVRPGGADARTMPGGAEVARTGVGDAVAGVMTVQQVIDALLADIPGAPFPKTVDTIKAGDPGQPVKGIVTTMFATGPVIEKAIGLGANFIIAHEPTFYNHLDETDWLAGDPVYTAKRELLDKHGIVVWRFHDGLHAYKPDGVRMGVLQALGWDKYYSAENPPLVTIPSLSFGELCRHAKKALNIEQLKVIGDAAESCSRIVLSPGSAGGRSHIAQLRQYKPDCFICGELNEWETSEYIRDARFQGQKLTLIDLGHAVSEEPGLQWLVPVLKRKAPGIPVTHIPTGDAFHFV